ncbi:hypothetical protein D9756_004507 [Leucocoprinus leucothites]|uniref:F-box domain-containing protein n=1 Tax=Leucocoprinus leucothites TaxID=201217 RepID=A0A8H5G8W7_9AGAR|nr:hypothetical protein D9756_004507 [Leucoagaricus leucothites]
MALTLEICRNVVSEIGSRNDLARLCQVSQGFRTFAERALYNTLYMRNVQETLLLCRTLSYTARIAALVDALTIYTAAEVDSSLEESGSSDEESEPPQELPHNYWSCVARALEQTINLQYLNIHIANSTNADAAWALSKCTFQLRGFHCDLNWDNHLISFLNKQTDLDDLYLLDYIDSGNASTPASEGTPSNRPPSLSSAAFPHLSTLECTFSEAAIAITPGRPITRLKTCFSRTRVDEKRTELTELLTKVRQSSRSLRALDIADSEYTTSFSMELLSSIVASRATSSELRYLGTLVLPISGRERLQFYGLLMRLPRIQCVEVEVSDWIPPPSSPPAFRALASEMRLYTPSVSRVVFVHNFDRTVVSVVDGVCRMDNDASCELLWRET